MKIVRLWGPAILWMGVIFFLSGRQSVEISPDDVINFLFFKTLHVLEYAFLFILLFRATKYTCPGEKQFLWHVLAFCFTVLYAITDEIHQTFVLTREGRLRDVIIDAAGAAIAWITIYQLRQRMPKKLRNLASKLQLL